MQFIKNHKKYTTSNLSIVYSFTPWDDDTVGGKSSEIIELELLSSDNQLLKEDGYSFIQNLRHDDVCFVTSRMPHDRVLESKFLEEIGFRFIELNYRPYLDNLQSLIFDKLDAKTYLFEEAGLDDCDNLSNMAEATFKYSRFHLDPAIDKVKAGQRYKNWIKNAYLNSNQKIIKCMYEDSIVAFFVLEQVNNKECFWSLVGMASEYKGQGMAKDVWRAKLNWLKDLGYNRVETSISSQNISVMNLYVRLGFRFNLPCTVMHMSMGSPNNLP